MSQNIPPQPPNSYRVTLELNHKVNRLDSVLMEQLRLVKDNLDLKNITRSQFKKLFNDKKIQIKGQAARPASSVSAGTTYVDILGYGNAGQ
ncbi:MAG: hypothetical protein JST80_01315 [Bdellovibrionales bacterium]|nr:hypothetical protein [Bdellovibrionales bacterium]